VVVEGGEVVRAGAFRQHDEGGALRDRRCEVCQIPFRAARIDADNHAAGAAVEAGEHLRGGFAGGGFLGGDDGILEVENQAVRVRRQRLLDLARRIAGGEEQAAQLHAAGFLSMSAARSQVATSWSR
jgi:hypothetical protein